MTYEIETERLFLRAPRMADAPAIARGLANYNVTRFLSRVPFPYDEDLAEAWISGLPDNRADHAVFVVEHGGAGVIGAVGVESELGYWFAEEHWGHGYATEAGRGILAWHFANIEAQSVPSAAHVDNPASLNVQRKLGFEIIGREKRLAVSRGEDVEHIDTLLTRSAFEQTGALS
jgi:RimJ/RimL family protein N-acetyltransferase